MQHINSERIAALADEPATLVEREHLAGCVECNAELAAAQRLVQMALTDTPAIERPLTSWARLGPALRDEGLVRIPIGSETDAVVTDVVPLSAPRARTSRWMMQAAAGIFLLIGGAVVGRASAGAPVATVPDSTVAQAANTNDTNFRSTADAVKVLERASNDYQRAVAYIAVHDSNVTMSGRDAAEFYSARLDALEKTVAATRAALYRAPQDPVLNSYYLQSVGARDLTLRQMGSVVPVSATKRTKF